MGYDEFELVNNFQGGLNERDADFKLADNELQVLINMLPTKDGGLEKRAGTLKYNSTVIPSAPEVHSLFRYYKSVTSFKEMLAVAGNSLYKGNDGTGVWTEIGTNAMSTSDPCSFVTWQEKVYICNGTVFKQYDGTTLSDVSGTPPDCKYIALHKDRLYISGNPAAPNRLYYCDTGDPTAWGIGLNEIEIDTNDGDEITGILPLKSVLVIYKQNSIFIYAGDPALTSQLTRVVNGVGCISPKSLKAYKGLHYLFHRTGFYAFNGAEAVEISDKVDPTVEDIPQTRVSDVVGGIYRGMYIAGYTIPSESTNSKVLVFSTRFGWWAKFDGINIASICNWDKDTDAGELYYGDFAGFVHQYDTGLDDNGVDIPTSVKTKYLHGENPFLFRTYKSILTVLSSSNIAPIITLNGDRARHTTSVTVNSVESLSLWGTARWGVDVWSSYTVTTYDIPIMTGSILKVRGVAIEFSESSAVNFTIHTLGAGFDTIRNTQRKK